MNIHFSLFINTLSLHVQWIKIDCNDNGKKSFKTVCSKKSIISLLLKSREACCSDLCSNGSFLETYIAYLVSITGSLLNPLQFAYKTNRSVEDTVDMDLHFILRQLDSKQTTARILFVEFSFAFNVVIPELLQTKLSQLTVPNPICWWITSFPNW